MVHSCVKISWKIMSNWRSPKGIEHRTSHQVKGIFQSWNELESLLSLHLLSGITLCKGWCTIRMKAQKSFLVSCIYLPVPQSQGCWWSGLVNYLVKTSSEHTKMTCFVLKVNPTKNSTNMQVPMLDDMWQLRVQNYLLWGGI